MADCQQQSLDESTVEAHDACMTSTATITITSLIHFDGQPVEVCSRGCEMDLIDANLSDFDSGKSTWVHARGVCAYDGRPLG